MTLDVERGFKHQLIQFINRMWKFEIMSNKEEL